MNTPDDATPLRLEPIWASAQAAHPPLDRDLTVDVAIIGAGITGLTLALRLKEAGLRVAVLEMSTIGGGETRFTTGHLATALDIPQDVLVRRFGAEGAAEGVRKSAAAIDHIESQALRHGIACDFRRVDGWRYAEPGAPTRALLAERDAGLELGLDLEWHASGPLSFMGGSLRFPRQARFDPMAWVRGLAAALVEGGGCHLFEHTLVEKVADGEPCEILAGGHVVRAAHVVHASHVPVGLVLPLQARVAPYLSYVVAVEIDAPAPPDLYWDDLVPYHYIRSVTLPEGGNAVIIGGEDHKTGQEPDTRSRFTTLEAWARARFPVTRVVSRWSGEVFQPADGLPYIGRLARQAHVYGATGFAGNGLTLGTAAALEIADLILGAAPLRSVFRPQRFRPLAEVGTLLRENANVAWRLIHDRIAAPERTGCEHVRPGSGEILTVDGERTAVHRAASGELRLLSPVCPHAGGIVQWNEAASTWDCPLHGSRFTPTGDVMCGPAVQGLATEADPGPTGDEIAIPTLLADLHDRGYTCELASSLTGVVTCHSHDARSDAKDGHIEVFHRFEGASDPDDVCVVAAVRLARADGGHCRGVMVLGFGPSASAEDKATFAAFPFDRERLRRSRREGRPPATAA